MSRKRETNSIFKKSMGWLMRELRSLLKKITMMRSKIKMEAGKSRGYPLSLMKTTNTHSQFPRLTSYLLSDLECLITATMSILSTIIMEG